ncbi:MAG: replication protein [Eubacteriales bacterium]
MASPQYKSGFTRIENKILEAITAAKLNGTQYAIVLCIWRYSYVFQSMSCPLSIHFIEKATGLSRRGIQSENKTLIALNVIIVSREPTFDTPREFAFQENITRWSIIPQAQNSSSGEQECTQQRKPKKNIKKLSSDGCLNEPFDRFWTAYPRQQAKQDALKAFRKLDPDETLLTVIIGSVGLRAASEEWRRDDGRYIPLPVSYIRGRRWEDSETKLQPEEKMPKRKFLN